MVAGTHLAACAHTQDKLKLKGLLSRGGPRAVKLAEEAAGQLGQVLMLYASIDQLAADEAVDFAIIATPPNAREDIIAPLAEAGKHILLEKPIGRTALEAEHIVSICRDAGVQLGVVFQHRARLASRKAQELVLSERLGQLGVVEISVPWWRDQQYYDEPGRGTYERDGGGVLISQAIHTIDLALSLTGPVSSVSAMAATSRFHSMESEDFVVAALQFANGAVGSMRASTASFPGGSETITLHFDNASLHLESGELVVSYRDGSQQHVGEQSSTGGGADPMAFTHHGHQQVLENFIDTLNGEADILASGNDAINAQRLIDATLLAAKSHTVQLL